MKSSGKSYAPVTPFERQTSHCPLYIAWLVLDEARDYFRTPIPETFANQLAHRAERVFAGNPFWQRKYKSVRGRDYLLMTMRHWLAGVLAKERPALFRALPDSFKLGHPLPSYPVAAVCDRRTSRNYKTRRSQSAATSAKLLFVHGGELLAA
jgi:hypothetical protein